mmetsp:Transcript_2376/g.9180  ORF Transcript_2376/g.9180 Transcript_2376/m.9180 type:complete len:223 (-) Transcript_2376:1568-2236(-)
MSTHWPSADAGGHEHRHEPWCLGDDALVPSPRTAAFLVFGFGRAALLFLRALAALAALARPSPADADADAEAEAEAEADAAAAAASSAAILAAAAFLAAASASASLSALFAARPAPMPPRIVCHIVLRSPLVHGFSLGVTAAPTMFQSARSVATSSTTPLKTPLPYGSDWANGSDRAEESIAERGRESASPNEGFLGASDSPAAASRAASATIVRMAAACKS